MPFQAPIVSFQTVIDTQFGEEVSSSFSRDKRDAIFDAAAKIFAQNGFHKAETQKIADLAGVSNGTVFRYFVSKEYLFWALSIWIGEMLEKRTQPIVDSNADCITKLRQMAATWCEFYSERPDFVDVAIRQRTMIAGTVPDDFFEYTKKQFFLPFYNIVQAGVERREIFVDDIRIGAFTICETIHSATMTQIYARGLVTLEQHMHNMLEPHLEHLARTKPITK
ncbi:MAG: TetR/AcrR family transcriptional regulator [Thermoguttaceae bacterium]